MSVESFLNGRVTLHAGDAREIVRGLADNSIDSVCTDPPYALVSIGKRFGSDDAAPAKVGKTGAYARASAGFMGKKWDTGETAFAVEFWREILRIVKPGGHIVAFGGTRSYHRLACAIEDAGFEIRDCLMWHFGSGFPKSHDVSKGIDKAAGLDRQVIRERYSAKRIKPGGTVVREGAYGKQDINFTATDTAPASAEAAQWQGWGTALKPATEIICLARKPLSEPTIAANVLRWGTGGLNIDGCRVEGETVSNHARGAAAAISKGIYGNSVAQETYQTNGQKLGRWPANLVHDGSEEVLAGFPDAPGQQQDIDPSAPSPKTGLVYGKMNREGESSAARRYTVEGSTNFSALPGQRRADSGSAARYFYTAKADADDRLGSKHPTVKPVDLMQWLVRLITPPQGVILDPFAGTGTTGEAAFREGFRAVLIERESEYCADIRRRMALCLAGPVERSHESTKARHGDKPQDHGPLFAEAAE